MTIKEVEERTGLSRSNVRFYEKEKLIEPSRKKSEQAYPVLMFVFMKRKNSLSLQEMKVMVIEIILKMM